jgi:hypothetical protein
MSEITNNTPASDQRPIEPRNRLIVVLALVAVIGLVAWVLSGGSGKDKVATPSAASSQSTNAPAPATVALTAVPASIVSKEQLIAATKDLGFVTYWNGEMDGTSLELTVLPEGKVFVRYLPKDVAAGATEPYFTVATYYDPAALAKVENVGATAGSKFVRYGGGAVAGSASESDSNIYFAFDGNPALYNIYSPDPKDAWNALESGTIAILR